MWRLVGTSLSRRPPVSSSSSSSTLSRRWYSPSWRCLDSSAGEGDQQPNYFQTLGIENENFGISMNDVKSLYKQLMRELHPDRHTMKPAEEQQRLHNEAAKVTHAYNVILHPHTRATHLLELRGRPLDGTSQVDLVGQDFLMEIMEVRGMIDDTDTPQEDLRQLQESNRQRIHDMCLQLDQFFRDNDLDEALRLTAELQYTNQLDETLLQKIL